MGFLLEPYHRSIRKRQLQSAKFFFFDIGVKRALARTLNQKIVPQTYAYGDAFEHFIICEMQRLNAYKTRDFKFSYLRTKDDAEIDVIIDRPGMPPALVEIKSSTRTDERDVEHLRSFLKDFPKADAYCLSQDPTLRLSDGIHFLSWQKGFEEIGF